MVQTAVAIIPMRPPPVGYNPSVVMMGKYTDIVKINAPDSAAQGELVNVTVRVKNIDSLFDHLVACVVIVDGLRFIDEVAIIPSLKTHSFSGAFGMAGGDVTIYAYSYYPYYGEWILDDEATKDVDLTVVVEWVLLATKSISLDITAPPEVWVLLATKSISVGIALPPEIWLQLAEGSVSLGIAAPPEVWVLAAEDEISLGIAAPPTEWILLETRTIDIGLPPPIPPEFKQVYHEEYPFAKTYVGKAEECTAKFRINLPDQFYPSGWAIDKIASAFEEKVEEEGGKMLDLKIYEDTTPTFYTDYIIVATAKASPMPWVAIIAGILGLVLAIWLTVVLTDLLVEWKEVDWGMPVALIPIAAIIIGLALLVGVGIVATKKKERGEV